MGRRQEDGDDDVVGSAAAGGGGPLEPPERPRPPSEPSQLDEQQQQQQQTFCQQRAAVEMIAAEMITAKERSGFMMLLVTTLISVVFYGGSVFSCQSFHDSQSSTTSSVASLDYGWRGFMDDSGECLDWSYNDGRWNDGWYQRLETLFIIGIVGFVMSVFLLVGVAYKTWISKTDNHLGGRTVLLDCCSILFGILALGTLLGNCKNIPPLGPGGAMCDYAVWAYLGVSASLLTLVMQIFLCRWRRRCCCC